MDKLTVINNALTNTGNDTVNVLNDPSDEYRVANKAFDRWVEVLTVRHHWPFAATIEKLVRAPDADNRSRRFSGNGFRLPQDVFHLREVYHGEAIITDYEVMGDILSTVYRDEIFAAIVRRPADARWHPLAKEILTLYVESGCLRGLNEDFREAERREAAAENMMMETRPHLDQQNPARNVYKSRIAAARRSRRV